MEQEQTNAEQQSKDVEAQTFSGHQIPLERIQEEFRNIERKHLHNDRKPSLKKPVAENFAAVQYNGQTIYVAAGQGNLPVCVLLWGMAAGKRQNVMAPDQDGNNPAHFACLARTPEVFGFFSQQLKGMFTPDVRLVDSRNNAGETPLLRAMMTGEMTVIKVCVFESPASCQNRLQLTYFCRHCWMTKAIPWYAITTATQCLLSAPDMEMFGA